MIRDHPLKPLIKSAQKELSDLCLTYADNLEVTSLNPFSAQYQRILLRQAAWDLSDNLETQGMDFVRQAISDTIRHLEEQTGKVLEGTELMELEVQIERRMLKQFAGKTLGQRFVVLKKNLTKWMLDAYSYSLSGLNDDLETSLKEAICSKRTYHSALGWASRLIISEMLRAYHYTVMEFAMWISAHSITLIIDPNKWEDEMYSELAEGSPYAPSDLPDYPRPMANYLLELSY